MKKIRLIALLLAAMVVATSCTGDGGGEDTSKTPSTDNTPSAAGELGLPEDLRFDLRLI